MNLVTKFVCQACNGSGKCKDIEISRYMSTTFFKSPMKWFDFTHRCLACDGTGVDREKVQTLLSTWDAKKELVKKGD